MLSLQQLREDWGDCQRCDLCKTRRHLVFGEGNPNADVLIIGEAPGEQEDKKGRPFIGPAGEVLDQMLAVVSWDRHTDIYVTNTVCCRPTMKVKDERTGEIRTENRQPSKEEREACWPRLQELIYIIDPLLIIAVGKVPVQVLLGRASVMSNIRGHIHTVELQGRHVPLRYAMMPVYHTAFLLRTYDRREVGPWGQTVKDFVMSCNVIDHLRNVYYGTPVPDREKLLNERSREGD